LQKVRVRGQRPVRGAPTFRRGALGARAELFAQSGTPVFARQLDQAARELVVVRAFQQRPFGPFDERGRIGAVHLPVRAHR